MPSDPPSLQAWSARPVLPDGDSSEPTDGRVLIHLLAVGCAVAGLLVQVLTGDRPVSAALVLAAAGTAGMRFAVARPRPSTLLGGHLLVRLVLITTVGVALATSGPVWVAWLAAGLLMLTACGEPLLVSVLTGSSFVAAHLPGIPAVRQPTTRPAWPPLAGWGALVLGAVLAAVDLSPVWWLAGAVLAAVVPAVALLEGLVRMRGNGRVRAKLARAVRDYQPEFIIYAGRPDDASYQVTMWLDHLRRTDRRFLIVARARKPAQILARLTKDPVLYCPGVADIERILVPSLRAVFYVNASSANGQMVRYQQFDHIYLGHGDSDKAPSYNPTHAMYDYVFAAGQAAVDRYGAHGVAMDPGKFVVVGRPQIEALDRVDPTAARPSAHTVLYAPTWRGHVNETLLYSLPEGERIVRSILDRGATVIFRPHPFNLTHPADADMVDRIDSLLREDAARTGRRHVWGQRATHEMGIEDCFNASTAMVSDVSSVVSDYLYTGKPFAMYSICATARQFTEDFPVARGSYVLDRDLGNLESELDELLGSDPMAARREQIRAYYLGDFPDDGYADVFVDRARRVIDRTWRPAAGEDRQAFEAEDGWQGDAAGEDRDRDDRSVDDGAAEAETDAPAATGGEDTAGTGQFAGGRRSLLQGEALAAVPVLTGVAAVAVGAGTRAGWLAAVLVALTLAVVTWSGVSRGRREPAALATWPTTRLLASLAVLFLVLQRSDPTAAATGVVATTLVLTIALEEWVRAARRVKRLRVEQLPTLDHTDHVPPYQAWMFPVALVPPWVLLVLGLATLPVWFGAALSTAAAVAAAWMVLRERQFLSAHRRATGRLKQAIADYRPEFVVYFASRSGVEYQVGMWMPYFERIGRRFIVVCRYEENVEPLAGLTDAPVVLCRTLPSLEDTLVPSLQAAFYVNNGVTNTHYIEHRELTHVWLNHGDSEKPACFNPVHAIYDRIFAAGQAGVDRYARHGVDIPRQKFEVVGRPQVSGIEPAQRPIGEISHPTVLYAPTWVGPYADSRLYSLPQGAAIVRALLDRDCTVVFRAHPFNHQFPESKAYLMQIWRLLEEDRRQTGRAHRFGDEAEQVMDLKDCFNASDAMVADVSAVVTDYLQSGKPFAMVAAESNSEWLIAEAPVAVAAYPLMGDLSNLERVLDDLLVHDPLAEQRRATREYYLGSFPGDVDPAEPFLRAARRQIDTPTPEHDALATR